MPSHPVLPGPHWARRLLNHPPARRFPRSRISTRCHRHGAGQSGRLSPDFDATVATLGRSVARAGRVSRRSATPKWAAQARTAMARGRVGFRRACEAVSLTVRRGSLTELLGSLEGGGAGTASHRPFRHAAGRDGGAGHQGGAGKMAALIDRFRGTNGRASGVMSEAAG